MGRGALTGIAFPLLLVNTPRHPPTCHSSFLAHRSRVGEKGGSPFPGLNLRRNWASWRTEARGAGGREGASLCTLPSPSSVSFGSLHLLV